MGQNTIGTIITSITSIIVALIGAHYYYQPKASLPIEKCTITGTITSGENKPLRNAEIYLIRATGNENMVTTDDHGMFTFDKIDLASYWIVVRDNESGRSSRVLIESQYQTGELNVIESSLRYKLSKN